MDQKSTNPTPWQIAGVSCAFVLGLACLCSLVTFGVMGDLGRALTEPLRRLFRRAPAEFTLAYALAENESGMFHLGPNCEVFSARGESFDSTAEPYQRDLAPGEAAERAQTSIQTDTYVVNAGQISLLSGIPVQADLNGAQVNLRFDESGSSGSGNWMRSIAGTAEADIFQGDFYLSDNRSEVLDGRAVEQSTTLQASFRCPIVWTETSLP